METFLERCLVLIENQAAVRAHLIACLANLTIIDQKGFGIKCFVFLSQFLEPGVDASLRNYIKESIRDNILVRIRFDSIKSLERDGKIKLMLSFISGLNLLINSSDMAGLFKEKGYLNQIAKWIQDLKEMIHNTTKQKSKSHKVESEESTNLKRFYDEILE